MNLEGLPKKELDPGAVALELQNMLTEMPGTGRMSDEREVILGLLSELYADPSRAREVLIEARSMRQGRQEDADQGL